MEKENQVIENTKKVVKIRPSPLDHEELLKGLDKYIEDLGGKVWEDPGKDEIRVVGESEQHTEPASSE